MRKSRVVVVLILLILTVLGIADSKNPADYPLRIHIFNLNQTTFFRNRAVDEARGEGRANLFENGKARGIDFSYDCLEKIHPSFGFETYPAKWKKQGKELLVLFPVFGKTGSYFTCKLKTQVKDYTYFRSGNGLRSESPEQYKEWMVRHDYDPEHGKNSPNRLGPRPDSGTQE